MINTELLIALLGGGSLVQIATALLTFRQNRRQLNASALGTEVEALEKTIAVIHENFERANKAHREETERLVKRITELERANEELQLRLSQLTQAMSCGE